MAETKATKTKAPTQKKKKVIEKKVNDSNMEKPEITKEIKGTVIIATSSYYIVDVNGSKVKVVGTNSYKVGDRI